MKSARHPAKKQSRRARQLFNEGKDPLRLQQGPSKDAMPRKKPEHIAQEGWDAVDFPEIPEDRLREMKSLREKPELLRALKKARRALRAEKEVAK
jgi:hypothetical protein